VTLVLVTNDDGVESVGIRALAGVGVAAGLEVIVADNGVGIASASSSTTGTGGGLLTHSALLAIAGRVGVPLALDDFDIDVPLLVDLQPAGRLLMIVKSAHVYESERTYVRDVLEAYR